MARNDNRPDPFRGPDEAAISARLNWLRAGVLGANDGIVSMAALLVGVAAADPGRGVIVTAGIAGIAAGALSMGVGEFVSVSSQRDAEEAQIAREKVWQHARPAVGTRAACAPQHGDGHVRARCARRGNGADGHDALGIHARMHLGIDPDDLIEAVARRLRLVHGVHDGRRSFPRSRCCSARRRCASPLTFAACSWRWPSRASSPLALATAAQSRVAAQRARRHAAAMVITYRHRHP